MILRFLISLIYDGNVLYRLAPQILINFNPVFVLAFFYMNLFPISSYYVMDIFSGYIVARKYLWQFSLLVIMYECQLK